MWLLWVALLVFTAELTLAETTVYGSVNDSPEDVGQPPNAGLKLLAHRPPLDFVDTRGGPFGSPRENLSPPASVDEQQQQQQQQPDGGKEMDLFSQLKHLQLPSPRGPFGDRTKPASESEMASVRRSLAAVLQVLLPYGRLQQRPRHDDVDARPGVFGEGEDATDGGSLLPDGPETANYMLHGKLVELGPRQHQRGGPLPELPDALLRAAGQKRAAALRSTIARRSHIMPAVAAATGAASGEDGSFLPSISVGALTNLGDFFQNLKHNLESLESKHLNTEQVKLLEGQNMISNLRKEFVADYPKPAGSAAFLHAIRNYRPSHRIRALVSTVPELYRGTNYHDPVYMLAGLGK